MLKVSQSLTLAIAGQWPFRLTNCSIYIHTYIHTTLFVLAGYKKKAAYADVDLLKTYLVSYKVFAELSCTCFSCQLCHNVQIALSATGAYIMLFPKLINSLGF